MGAKLAVLSGEDESRREAAPVADHAVLVAGAGPTGLMLAGELALAGAGELEVPIYRGREVTSVAHDHTGVDVRLADDRLLRAQYLVGCDGGRSVIRKAAGIDFPGWDPTTSYLIAEVEMAFGKGEEPKWGIRHDAFGVHALSNSDDGGPVRVMVTEQHLTGIRCSVVACPI
nr:FAD-dependent monooxygenase [Mycobacterium gastri]